MQRPMTPAQAAAVTEQFYSQFCATDLTALPPGVHFIPTTAREAPLAGLGCRYTLYLLRRGPVCALAYAPRHAAWLEALRGCDAAALAAAIAARLPVQRRRLMILRREIVTDLGDARPLTAADYPLYETFFCQAYPGADPTGWLREYFAPKAAQGLFFGYPLNGALVCVCDAPDMPYLAGQIQHTGIHTLPQARRRGYARCTAALAAHRLLAAGICPQWDCAADNTASAALAAAIGYEEYGQALVVEETLSDR